MKDEDHNKILNELGINHIRDSLIKTKGKPKEDVRKEINNSFSNNLDFLNHFELILDFRKGLLKNEKIMMKDNDIQIICSPLFSVG